MKISRHSKAAAGWGLILLGIAGVMLPVLPGIPFLLAGLVVLSAQYTWSRRLLEVLRRKLVPAWRHHRAQAGPTPVNQSSPSPQPPSPQAEVCEPVLEAKCGAVKDKQ